MATDPLAFPFVGGRPALNFVGTLGKRGSEDIERLRTADDLARWADEAGLGPASFSTAPEPARLLREAIYGLILGATGRAPARPEDVALVNEWAAHGVQIPQLVLRGGTLHRDDSGWTASGVLAVVARDAVDLLTGPEAGMIRDCEDPTCTLYFVDTSRGRRRRWCSMDRCGARAKMRTLRSSS